MMILTTKFSFVMSQILKKLKILRLNQRQLLITTDSKLLIFKFIPHNLWKKKTKNQDLQIKLSIKTFNLNILKAQEIFIALFQRSKWRYILDAILTRLATLRSQSMAQLITWLKLIDLWLLGCAVWKKKWTQSPCNL